MQASVMTNMLYKAEEASAKMSDKPHHILGGGSMWVLAIKILLWVGCLGSVVWFFLWHHD